MASPAKVQHATALISLFFLSWTHLSSSTADVHDLLALYNLPKGLLPREIKSYSLSNTDQSFTIELGSDPCYVRFGDHLVYYDRIVRGKLGFGEVTRVSGIQAKKLFLWVSVTAIGVDGDSIEFHVGALSEKLPARDFEAVRSCRAKGLRESFGFVDMVAQV